MTAAFITGLASHTLSPDERAFLRDAQPAGLILFARNIDTPAQVQTLIATACEAIGAPALVLIDQEGGRVQRLRPPQWRALPAGRCYGAACATLAAAITETRLISRLIAHDLRALGITCNCTPVVDVPVPGAHDIIGDRALGRDPATIAALGRAIAEGHQDGGVIPVIKHIPGHGRATADSHLELPTVTTDGATLELTDFAPFRALNDMPAAMTAHVVFTALDRAQPASTSARIHRDILRGSIGFDGLLMSDDLSMKALAGPMRDRAAAVIAAGSDLALHCNGQMDEMRHVAAGVPPLAGAARTRFNRALQVTHTQKPFDLPAAEACLARLLALPAANGQSSA